jgi:hypothetical protein
MAYFVEECNDMASRKKAPGLPFDDMLSRFQQTTITGGLHTASSKRPRYTAHIGRQP